MQARRRSWRANGFASWCVAAGGSGSDVALVFNLKTRGFGLNKYWILKNRGLWALMAGEGLFGRDKNWEFGRFWLRVKKV
jgi:hypothetical protein